MRKLFALTLLILGAFVLLGAQGITLGKGATYGKGMTISPGSTSVSAPTFVQDTYNTSSCAGGPATCSVAAITTTTNHALYVQVMYLHTATLTNITDTCGTSGGATNTYTSDFTYSTGSFYFSQVLHTIVGYGKSCVVTANYGGTGANTEIYVAEISGTNLTTPVVSGQAIIADQSAPGTGANAVTSGNITTTGTNTLIIASVEQCTGSPDSFSAGTGFTLSQNPGIIGNCTVGSEYQTFASIGSIAGTFTTTGGAGTAYMTAAVAFQHP